VAGEEYFIEDKITVSIKCDRAIERLNMIKAENYFPLGK
jgi:hypothetical protein